VAERCYFCSAVLPALELGAPLVLVDPNTVLDVCSERCQDGAISVIKASGFTAHAIYAGPVFEGVPPASESERPLD
jgi:hypothetical protein